MASATFVFLLLISALYFSAVLAAQQRSSHITLGSSLSPSSTNSSSWLSPSGTFAFGFYPQGNSFAIGIWFAQIPQRTVVWTSNRDDRPSSSNAKLLLTSDGGLVLQRTQQDQPKSISDNSQSASWASMLDTGTMSKMENTQWEENPYYAILSSTTEEECNEACLADKYCEATAFPDKQCRKLSFPLRYGRRILDKKLPPQFLLKSAARGKGRSTSPALQ
ncbi:G-type lectin S-receptor-like serine/threonine-protein kinase LECRK1 [Macadamia integrifolia]|uniref:G-type lectin S-receptor-like serine/threonine-protein kinase LECRK1 n=1 Tax=Macadamia integrifolia TaxID=60698 RepID=UPI001C4E8B42|nr:G-type lectin S-receptor-like serine/threonine-protein kinase LECRK1 [Macadamia integrifolia]